MHERSSLLHLNMVLSHGLQGSCNFRLFRLTQLQILPALKLIVGPEEKIAFPVFLDRHVGLRSNHREYSANWKIRKFFTAENAIFPRFFFLCRKNWPDQFYLCLPPRRTLQTNNRPARPHSLILFFSTAKCDKSANFAAKKNFTEKKWKKKSSKLKNVSLSWRLFVFCTSPWRLFGV